MSHYLNKHSCCEICSYQSTNIYFKNSIKKSALCLSCYNSISLNCGNLLSKKESNCRLEYLKKLPKNQLALELVGSLGTVLGTRGYARLGFKTYQHYLLSPLWNNIRNRILNNSSQCHCCKDKPTQVHHSSYNINTMAGYHDECLYPICQKCHNFIEYTGTKKNSLLVANQKLFNMHKQKTKPIVIPYKEQHKPFYSPPKLKVRVKTKRSKKDKGRCCKKCSNYYSPAFVRCPTCKPVKHIEDVKWTTDDKQVCGALNKYINKTSL